jgi:endogenous inhibitor of DNA gyrase (YacG/DUF329 family)
MDSENDNHQFAARPCPICGKPSNFADRPFCSRRCADIDLHHWFSGTYSLPVRPEAEQDDESTPAESNDPNRNN